MTNPTPEQIREARAAAGLSQAAAAALIGKPMRTWQNWEAPVESPSHRHSEVIMGAKTSNEMLRALELVRGGLTPYAAVKKLASEGLSITEQAICQRREYREIKDARTKAGSPP